MQFNLCYQLTIGAKNQLWDEGRPILALVNQMSLHLLSQGLFHEFTQCAGFWYVFSDHSWNWRSGHIEDNQICFPHEQHLCELSSGQIAWLNIHTCHKNAYPVPPCCEPLFYALKGEVFCQFQMGMFFVLWNVHQTLDSCTWTFWVNSYVLSCHGFAGCFCPWSESCSPPLHTWNWSPHASPWCAGSCRWLCRH